MKCSCKNCNNEAVTSFANQEVCEECYKKISTNVFIKRNTDEDRKNQSILFDY